MAPTLRRSSLSKNGHLLEITEGSQLDNELVALISLWPSWASMAVNRSEWLKAAEDKLREVYPHASRADLNLTARSIAPFPLAAGHNVP